MGDTDRSEYVLAPGALDGSIFRMLRQGQRVVFVTTQGFEDVPFIQRINRKSLFDLQWRKPDPYVARRDCVGSTSRWSSAPTRSSSAATAC